MRSFFKILLVLTIPLQAFTQSVSDISGNNVFDGGLGNSQTEISRGFHPNGFWNEHFDYNGCESSPCKCSNWDMLLRTVSCNDDKTSDNLQPYCTSGNLNTFNYNYAIDANGNYDEHNLYDFRIYSDDSYEEDQNWNGYVNFILNNNNTTRERWISEVGYDYTLKIGEIVATFQSGSELDVFGDVNNNISYLDHSNVSINEDEGLSEIRKIPEGFEASVLLGQNNVAGGGSEQIKRTFTVSNNSPFLEIANALFMEKDGTINCPSNSFFRASLYNENGNEIYLNSIGSSAVLPYHIPLEYQMTSKGFEKYYATPNDEGYDEFRLAPRALNNYVWIRDWQSAVYDLTDYINEEVTIEFQIAESSYLDTYAYAYVAAKTYGPQIIANGEPQDKTLCMKRPVTFSHPDVDRLDDISSVKWTIEGEEYNQKRPEVCISGKSYSFPVTVSFTDKGSDKNQTRLFRVYDCNASDKITHTGSYGEDDAMCIYNPYTFTHTEEQYTYTKYIFIRYDEDEDTEANFHRWFVNGVGVRGSGNEFTKCFENAEAKSVQVVLDYGCPESKDDVVITKEITIGDCRTSSDCEDCIPEFAPTPNQTYVLSAWVKGSLKDNDGNYSDVGITVGCGCKGNETGGWETLRPKGPIIEGWQRIEDEISFNSGFERMSLFFENENQSADVFFDDIRIFPVNANMKSFVYDPVTRKLVAELDENNYATFYEYDEEGTLVRVKKETEGKVETLKEARSASSTFKFFNPNK